MKFELLVFCVFLEVKSLLFCPCHCAFACNPSNPFGKSSSLPFSYFFCEVPWKWDSKQGIRLPVFPCVDTSYLWAPDPLWTFYRNSIFGDWDRQLTAGTFVQEKKVLDENSQVINHNWKRYKSRRFYFTITWLAQLTCRLHSEKGVLWNLRRSKKPQITMKKIPFTFLLNM